MKQVTAQDLLQRCKAIVEGAHPHPLPFWVARRWKKTRKPRDAYELLFDVLHDADPGINVLMYIEREMLPLDIQLAARVLGMDVEEAKPEGVTLNPKEARLVARLLEIASDQFTRHGCNDLPDDFWEDWTRLERQALCKAIQEDNGTPEDYYPDHLELPDWLLMEYMRDRLRGVVPLQVLG